MPSAAFACLMITRARSAAGPVGDLTTASTASCFASRYILASSNSCARSASEIATCSARSGSCAPGGAAGGGVHAFGGGSGIGVGAGVGAGVGRVGFVGLAGSAYGSTGCAYTFVAAASSTAKLDPSHRAIPLWGTTGGQNVQRNRRCASSYAPDHDFVVPSGAIGPDGG